MVSVGNKESLQCSVVGLQDTSCQLRLYDKESIDQASWPSTKAGARAQAALVPLVKLGPEHFLDNVTATMQVLEVDDLMLPVTVTDTITANSWVCSPYSHYVRYADETFTKHSLPWVGVFLRLLLRPVKLALRLAQVDRVVTVNNWLLSTNLYPELSERQIEGITSFLKEHYPDHAILFRSVNRKTNSALLEHLKCHGYLSIPSRKVFISDPSCPRVWKARNIRKDLKLRDRSDYELIGPDEINEGDLSRIKELYEAVNIDKHSSLNPRFNENYFRLALKNGVVSLWALRKEGRIDGFSGLVIGDGISTRPMVGYDTTLPKETGLYRLLSLQELLDGKEHGVIVNLSAGADSFKQMRRATPEIEYSAVFAQHLPLHRRVVWWTLSWLSSQLGIPFMMRWRF